MRILTTLPFIIRHFAAEEKGALSFLGIFMFLAMATFGGLGVDLMMSEVKRTKLQATLDSAVLAAASMRNTHDPEETVRDHMIKAGLGDYVTRVHVVETANSREVTASANRDVQANFLRLLGIDMLKVAATSTAQESLSNVEVSLVLDVTGSMGWDNNKRISELKPAAKRFVDMVLGQDTSNRVSISLVPYSAGVALPKYMYDAFNTTHQHDYAYCIDFEDSQYEQITIDKSLTYKQMKHWTSYSFFGTYLDSARCSNSPDRPIQAFSSNVTALHDQIELFHPGGNTSIFMGLKWGAGLLDPSTRFLAQAGVTAGVVDEKFKNRPADYTDDKTAKHIVLMSDGAHIGSFDLEDEWYDTPEEREWFSQMTLASVLATHFPDGGGPTTVTKYTSTQGVGYMKSICDAAKAQGVTIWAVAVDIQVSGIAPMQDCASSPAHYFEVASGQMEDSFSSIARSLVPLKLTN